MPPKRKQTKLAKMMQQCKHMPGQFRQVCEAAAKSRYDRHYHPSNPFRRRHIVVDAVMAGALVISVLFAAYIGLFYRRAAQHQQVELSLIPSLAAVASGDALSAELVINNNGKQTLLNSYLTVPASVGFVLSQSEPATGSDQRIVLGDLKSGTSVNVTLTGYVVGEVGSAARINAVLHYRTAGFSAEDEKYVSESVFVSGSSLDLSATFPEAIAANKPFEFEISYENRSSVTSFANASIVPVFPADWEMLESSLRPDPATGVWTIDNIGSLQHGVITGRARVRSTVILNAPITVQIFAAPEGQPLLQDSWEAHVPVFSPELAVSARLSAGRVALGQSVTVSVTMVNDETFTLNEPELRLSLNEHLVVLQGSQGTFANGLLTVPLDPLSPGETRVIDIDLSLREKIVASEVFGTESPVLAVHGEVAYKNTEEQTMIVPINEFRSLIDSDLGIVAHARYFSAEGEPIGVGPLPPRVGEKTTYFVFIELENQLHPLRDVVVTAQLGEDALWEDKSTVSVGSAVQYDASTRTVTWNIDALPDYKSAFAGTSYGAALQLSVLPDESMRGSPVLLLTDIVVRATDTVTGNRIRAGGDIIVTTQLSADAHATDNGQVTM